MLVPAPKSCAHHPLAGEYLPRTGLAAARDLRRTRLRPTAFLGLLALLIHFSILLRWPWLSILACITWLVLSRTSFYEAIHFNSQSPEFLVQLPTDSQGTLHRFPHFACLLQKGSSTVVIIFDFNPILGWRFVVGNWRFTSYRRNHLHEGSRCWSGLFKLIARRGVRGEGGGSFSPGFGKIRSRNGTHIVALSGLAASFEGVFERQSFFAFEKLEHSFTHLEVSVVVHLNINCQSTNT